MLNNNNIFSNKKILIYGLGKSGLSAYQYLKKHNTLYLFDDKKISTQNIEIKRRLIKYNNINNNKFDRIIISPGIDLNKCKLSKYLKKNLYKINTDFDIFYSFYSVCYCIIF